MIIYSDYVQISPFFFHFYLCDIILFTLCLLLRKGCMKWLKWKVNSNCIYRRSHCHWATGSSSLLETPLWTTLLLGYSISWCNHSDFVITIRLTFNFHTNELKNRLINRAIPFLKCFTGNSFFERYTYN